MQEWKTFSELQLPQPLLESLAAMKFEIPTPVQAQAIPPALEGRDILAIAPTGTGKTGAFGIPMAALLYPQPGKQVLILAPTRELAAQIYRFLRTLTDPLKLQGTLIVGGESYFRQRMQVKRGVDYIIATPGRLMDHMNQGMPVERISMLVLDEVDRMLDMGFAPQVEEIAKRLPPERQTFLFSATMPQEIQALAAKYLKNPIKVTVAAPKQDAALIHEENITTTDGEKPRLLLDQVTARTGKILVFANTQGRVEQVLRGLEHAGHKVAGIHGGRTHRERKMAMEAFRTGEVRILVATDIVARGIDVADIEHVINFDYPATKEDYLHRIGRTGRIGKKGSAITFIDARRLRMSQRSYRKPVHGAFGKPRSFQKRPGFDTGPRPFPREGGSEKKPFRREGGSFNKKPFRREGGFEKKPFTPREGGFEKKPFRREAGSFDKRPFRREGGFEKKPFTPREGGFEKRPFRRQGGFQRDEGFKPNRNIFRAGEDRGGAPAPAPRGVYRKATPKPERTASAHGFKPWVRGKRGSVRRQKDT